MGTMWYHYTSNDVSNRVVSDIFSVFGKMVNTRYWSGLKAIKIYYKDNKIHNII